MLGLVSLDYNSSSDSSDAETKNKNKNQADDNGSSSDSETEEKKESKMEVTKGTHDSSAEDTSTRRNVLNGKPQVLPPTRMFMKVSIYSPLLIAKQRSAPTNDEVNP
eukprot:CAMPEP_0115007420 /NCGR_PEP_ID=MMETSP0216-20121206/21170_1 /TAXON_ID=223996 /ORGANISM="Protocruzia adherens, Strain Boccale" /LENGTH=106 /DNA_ID=CAMNT_0002374361 /DNA_START=151 /DNA_END=471 /DNA_ORIENTATION=+